MSERLTLEEVLREYGVPLATLNITATREECLRLREHLMKQTNNKEQAYVEVQCTFFIDIHDIDRYLNGELPDLNTIYTFPGAVYEGTHHPVPSPAKTGKINIVVPGTVDVRRRDYNTVFQLLQACRQQALPVTVTLPGGYYGREGKEIINQCKAWAQQHDNLRFFETNLVDQPLFDQCMQESHVVLLPTRIETIVSDGVKETYGVSISSGTIFDVIRHAKPFIVPAALHIPGNLQSSAFRYHDPAAIIAFLQRLFSQEDYYADLCRQAVFNAAAYTIEKIRQQHPALLG